jgi:hypothetical protein
MIFKKNHQRAVDAIHKYSSKVVVVPLTPIHGGAHTTPAVAAPY